LSPFPSQRALAKAAAFGTPVAVLEQAAPNMELAWDMDAAFVARARALEGAGDKAAAVEVYTHLAKESKDHTAQHTAVLRLTMLGVDASELAHDHSGEAPHKN